MSKEMKKVITPTDISALPIPPAKVPAEAARLTKEDDPGKMRTAKQ